MQILKGILTCLILVVLLIKLSSCVRQTSEQPQHKNELGQQHEQQHRSHELDHSHELGHGHSHSNFPYEWSAEYILDAGTYTIEFQESEHDHSIALGFFRKNFGSAEEIAHLALHVMEEEMAEIAPGDHFYVLNQHAYNLQLNPVGTTFAFTISKPSTYIIFTEHFAWEFAMKIYNSEGQEIPPANETEYARPHEHE